MEIVIPVCNPIIHTTQTCTVLCVVNMLLCGLGKFYHIATFFVSLSVATGNNETALHHTMKCVLAERAGAKSRMTLASGQALLQLPMVDSGR